MSGLSVEVSALNRVAVPLAVLTTSPSGDNTLFSSQHMGLGCTTKIMWLFHEAD